MDGACDNDYWGRLGMQRIVSGSGGATLGVVGAAVPTKIS
jgi:hypothetical protein